MLRLLLVENVVLALPGALAGVGTEVGLSQVSAVGSTGDVAVTAPSANVVTSDHLHPGELGWLSSSSGGSNAYQPVAARSWHPAYGSTVVQPPLVLHERTVSSGLGSSGTPKIDLPSTSPTLRGDKS